MGKWKKQDMIPEPDTSGGYDPILDGSYYPESGYGPDDHIGGEFGPVKSY